MTIDYSITYLVVFFSYGFYNANISLVGCALGEGNIPKAKKIFKISAYMCFFLIISFVLVSIIFSEKIVSLYSTNYDVKMIASHGL